MIGLALGSGSARGLAHIGVLRALQEAGIGIDIIAGTSIGALVGAVAAAGKLDALADTFRALDWRRMAALFDPVLPRSGLIDGAAISAMLREHIASTSIESLALRYAAVATNIASGAEVVIGQGDVIEAVRASIAIPGILTPVRWQGQVLADGGLVNPVPVNVARRLGATTLIAVDLNHGIVPGKNLQPIRRRPARLPGWAQPLRQGLRDLRARLRLREAPTADPLPSIFEVLLASINIMEARITETRLALDRPDLLIQPPLGHIRILDFDRAEEIIEIGYQAAVAALERWEGVQPASRPSSSARA